MKQYRKNKKVKTSISQRSEVEGEHIETKVARIFENKEKIEEVAELTYTRRDEGVRPSDDIRTNKLEVALNAMNKASRSITAKRSERQLNENLKTEENKEEKETSSSTDGN